MNGSTSPTTVVLALSFLGMFLIVPGREARRFRSFALRWGTPLWLAVFVLGGPLLGLWRFHDRARIAGVPLMLVLSWYPIEVAFAYACELLNSWRQKAGAILAAAAGSTLLYQYLTSIGAWETLIPIKRIWVFLFSALVHLILAIRLHLRRPRWNGGSNSIPPLY